MTPNVPTSRDEVSEGAKAFVRRNTEGPDKGDFDLFEELFDNDFVDHTPQPNTPRQGRR